MEIFQINDIAQFDNLNATWDHVYAADPHTTFFSSWTWLKGWFEATDDNWCILTVRESKKLNYVAFLPVYKKYGQLLMAGNFMADHTGFVCLPSYQEEALKALSTYIQEKLIWEQLNFRDVIDPRLDDFLKYFLPQKYNLQELERTPCPFLTLPKTWDHFLDGHLSSSFRKEIKYKIRRIEKHPSLALEYVREDNLESHIQILLNLWQKRWGENSKQVIQCIRSILRSSFTENKLYLPVLWDGDHPVAARAAFVDSSKHTFYGFISGWDRRYAKYSPGMVMFANGFRFAIENGLFNYDFLRGTEKYKYEFGASDRFNRNIIISKKNWRTTAKKIMKKAWGVLNKV
jgi:CelD/BcsL family acetyltransferase involved in cellulose biosynthesis